MERLFTPWRMAYVTQADQVEGCVLCRVQEDAAGPLIVHTGALTFVVMNLFPYNGGHVMIAPRRHFASLGEATTEELSEMMALAQRVEAAFRQAYKPDGINLGMNLGRPAGAGVAHHIHLHVVPRWTGDTNFMTVVGETRVVPETPEQACLRLRPFFAR